MLVRLRGLGIRQKKEKDVTIGRICLALYQEPHISETLWKRTRIHKNAMVLRLNELVENGIVIKRHPHHIRSDLFRHNYYLLNWSKRESKDIISRAFDAEDSLSQLAFWFNSLDNSVGVGKVEPIPFNRSRVRSEIEKRIINLDIEEKSIMSEIVQKYTYQNRLNMDSQVIQKRDKTLTSLILACAQYYMEYLILYGDRPWAYDFLISLLSVPLRLYNPPFRPYVKVYEIMQRLGF